VDPVETRSARLKKLGNRLRASRARLNFSARLRVGLRHADNRRRSHLYLLHVAAAGPFKLYRIEGDGKREATDHSLYERVRLRPGKALALSGACVP
jgi:hypothetical protein